MLQQAGKARRYLRRANGPVLGLRVHSIKHEQKMCLQGTCFVCQGNGRHIHDKSFVGY